MTWPLLTDQTNSVQLPDSSSALSAVTASSRGCRSAWPHQAQRRVAASTPSRNSIAHSERCSTISKASTLAICLKYSGATPHSTKARAA